MSADLPQFTSDDERWKYTETIDRSFVMVPRRSAASIAIINDNPVLDEGNPNPAITLMGFMTDREGSEIPPDADGDTTLSLIFNDPDQALHLVAHLMTLFLNEDNTKLAVQAVMALANQDQIPIFVEAANAALDQLEKEEK